MGRDGFLVPVESQSSLVKKTAVSTSWVLLDQSGKGTILDLDKYAIMRRVHIHARDLRILDPLLSYPSTILGREKVIVLNLEHIKAIITAEEVLLRDPLDDNVIPIVEELQRRLPLTGASSKGQGEEEEQPAGVRDEAENGEENEFPFEFRALEVALEAICSFLDACTRELEAAAYPALDELTSKISSRNLDRVRRLKSSMTRLTNRVQKVRDELEQLLDDDEDMADLYLSRKLASSPGSGYAAPNWFFSSPTIGSKISRTSRASTQTVREENDVEELEMLLEAYFMQIDGTLNKLTTLREYIDDTEDYINIQLDNHRNQLIQLELFLCSGTVCVSVYSLVAAIFGMNIPYTWKEGHGYVFKWVVILTGILCAFILVSIISYARHKGLVGS
ncbi:Mg2+ transporter protein, Zinc transport protein [Trema orientale]|uniref:Magnesium transporter n=1 Tax=Trema orientale TaxID=63057 RepID=A0A2P5FB69_TREOI|nr:Mg2+ transporter protein, Zinc transport protein [Trema orientale]